MPENAVLGRAGVPQASHRVARPKNRVGSSSRRKGAYSMSAGLPEDMANTTAHWLRHRVNTQAWLIDGMLLGEGHTVEEIAQALHEAFLDDYPERQPADRLSGKESPKIRRIPCLFSDT